MKPLRWINFSSAWLLLLLQRTPALRLTAAAGEQLAPTRIVSLLRAAFAASASLGAVHSLAGATTFTPTQTSPVSATVGTALQLAFAITGSKSPAASWTVSGSVPPGLTFTGGVTSGTINTATLTLSGTPTTAGSYTFSLRGWERVNAGAAATIAYSYTVTVAGGIVTVGPTLTAQPVSQSINAGSSVTFAVVATGTGLSYQWQKDGTAIPGATQSTLTLASASPSSMGFYAATVLGGGTTLTSSIATLTVETGGTSRLINVSTRGYVPAGGSLTPGFVLQGNASKTLVIRAIGPTLGAFGVGGVLADPVMDVIPLGGSTAIASNDNWAGLSSLVSAFSRVGAFPLAAATSSDASVETTLRASGASGYTVRITSKNAAAGIALAEVYDEEGGTAPVRLVNVSTNGFVGTGDQALVPGFVIGGEAPKQLLIRAVGPGLAQFGVGDTLADPQLSLVPLGRDFTVATNDNWGGSAALQAAFAAAGAFALPAGSNDAAVVVRLPPGGYTVVVSGVGNTTGTALVEVYDLDP